MCATNTLYKSLKDKFESAAPIVAPDLTDCLQELKQDVETNTINTSGSEVEVLPYSQKRPIYSKKTANTYKARNGVRHVSNHAEREKGLEIHQKLGQHAKLLGLSIKAYQIARQTEAEKMKPAADIAQITEFDMKWNC